MSGIRARFLSSVWVSLLFVAVFGAVLNVPLASGQPGTIYIRADGSIDPPDAPISTVDNVTYTLTGNVTTDVDGIVVERDNIVVDGAGYTFQGTGVYPYKGIDLTGRSNVIIKTMNIKGFSKGIEVKGFTVLGGGTNNVIQTNNITNNRYGIYLGRASNNKISGNNIINNSYGVFFDYSVKNNTVYGNNITNNELGICLDGYISATYKECPENNTIYENNIADNTEAGVKLLGLDNIFYHNNFLSNTIVIGSEFSSGGTNDPELSKNILDNGYPSGGNYWSDYEGTDDFRGPFQNELGSDGIGDTPYSIDAGNQDRHPLMNPWTSLISANAVSGKVSEADGVTPIVGAIVEALQQGDLVVSSTTADANGNYSLPLTEGAYKVRASAVGYITATKPVVNITTGTTTANFNLTEGQTLVFDEFTGTSLNASRWNSHLTGLGAIGISNATWELTDFSCVGLSSGYGGAGSAALTSKATATLDSVIVFEGRVSAYWEGHWYPGVYADYQPRGLRVGTDPNNSIEFISYARDTVEARTVSSGTETVSQYLLPLGKMVGDYDLTYRIEATSESVKFYVNNTLIATHVTNIPTGQLNIYIGTSYDGFGNIPVSADYLYMAVLPPPAPQPKVGVKAGDWIKIDYTISGAPSGTPLPQWIKIEFLNVEGTTANIRVTMHMSDGTEPSQTMTVDVAIGSGAFQGLSGFVIPANSTTGQSVYISGYGNVTIAGETTRTYAGASRTVVYASFSQLGSQLTYYWDKQTGAMVEASTTSGSITATGKATETNMWQAQQSGLPFDQTYLYILAAVVIAIAVGAIAFVMRRKKKPPEAVTPTAPTAQMTLGATRCAKEGR